MCVFWCMLYVVCGWGYRRASGVQYHHCQLLRQSLSLNTEQMVARISSILLSPPSNLAGSVGLCDCIWLLTWVLGTGTQNFVLVQQAFLATENLSSLISFTIANKSDLDDYQHRERRNVWGYGYVELRDLAINWYMHTQKCHTVTRNPFNYDVSIRNKNIL